MALLLPFQESLPHGPGRISRPQEPWWVSQSFPESFLALQEAIMGQPGGRVTGTVFASANLAHGELLRSSD